MKHAFSHKQYFLTSAKYNQASRFLLQLYETSSGYDNRTYSLVLLNAISCGLVRLELIDIHQFQF